MRIGTDLVQVSRIASILEKSAGFATLVYTTNELRLADSLGAMRRDQFLAGRFAIKEAVLKALRLGIRDGSVLRDIESLSAEDGSPTLCLYGAAQDRAQEIGLRNSEVTLSHDAGLVVAFAVLT